MIEYYEISFAYMILKKGIYDNAIVYHTEEKMEQYIEKEREISISELFWSLARKWRIFVLWTAIFAVLAGGYSFAKTSRAAASEKDVQTEEERIETLRESLNVDEKRRLLEAELYADRLQETELWLEKNPLSRMDPYQSSTITLQYYVKSAPILDSEGRIVRDYSRDLISAFSAFVLSEENLSDLADLTEDLTAEDISYLLQCKSDDVLSNSFQVVLGGMSETATLVLAEHMKAAIAAYSQEIQDMIGEHTLVLISENSGLGTEESIIEERDLMADKLGMLRTKLEGLSGAMSEKEKEIYNYDVSADSDESQTVKETKTPRPRISAMYVLCGGILGFLLMCIWGVLFYILDRRVKTSKEVERLIPDTYVGRLIIKGEEKKRLFSVVDRWIDGLRNGEKSQLAIEEQMQILASNISFLCNKVGQREICITGTGIEMGSSEVMRLAEILKEKNVTLHKVDSALQSAGALEEMAALGAVLLWERVNRSRYEEIVSLLHLCKVQDIRILGAITVEI